MTNLASPNSQGRRSSDRRQTAFSFFRRNRLDVILLQETHWTVDLEIQITREWDGEVNNNNNNNNSLFTFPFLHNITMFSIFRKREEKLDSY